MLGEVVGAGLAPAQIGERRGWESFNEARSTTGGGKPRPLLNNGQKKRVGNPHWKAPYSEKAGLLTDAQLFE